MKDKDEGGDVSGDKYNSEIVVQISKQGSWKKTIRLQYFKLQRCSYMSYTAFYTGLFYCFLYNYTYTTTHLWPNLKMNYCPITSIKTWMQHI